MLSAECDDDDPCTLDLCADNACTHTDQCCDADTDCDDGDACTGDACVDGFCDNPWIGGDDCCVPALFRDDFSADLGWTHDDPWERGEAVAGPGTYSPDPETDHSSSDDDLLAGVVIGGTVPKVIGDWIWTTSPAFDTSDAILPTLSYWRWLKSDYTPYMNNRVEVWDGATWNLLWESGSYPAVSDAVWTFMDHDISAHKGPETRVRFGYMIGSSGVYTIGGWSLDDVQVLDSGADGDTCCGQTSDCQGIFDPAACLDGMCL